MARNRHKRSQQKARKTFIDFFDSPEELDKFVYNIPAGHYAAISPDRKRVIIRKGVRIWNQTSRVQNYARVVSSLT